MFAVKTLFDRVERACSDVAKNYAEGSNRKGKGLACEPAVVGIPVAGRQWGMISRRGIQGEYFLFGGYPGSLITLVIRQVISITASIIMNS